MNNIIKTHWGQISASIRKDPADQVENLAQSKSTDMTYREAIQVQIAALQKVYDNCEGLRDVAASNEEKEVWNLLRKSLPFMWRPLQRMDNNLPDGVAAYHCKGVYKVNITE